VTAVLALVAFGWFMAMFAGFALCRAAAKGDRQMRAALRDKHLRSLP